jgi:iron complex outermembrane receptor protein
LTLILETSFLYDLWGFQFYWQDNTHPYIAAPSAVNDENFMYSYIDPKIRYIDKKGNEHKIYAREYRQKNLDGLSQFWVSSIQYQFRHDFGKIFSILAGANDDHYTLQDGTLGDHKGDYGGGFVQGQLNYKFFSLNAGVREEFIHEDSFVGPALPVFRLGTNFEVRKYNYLRASFGQAFREPSIAEKYVLYSLGSVNILPNLNLKPEHGFTAELGYKRSIKIGNWLGYVDASTFWTEFKDMIQFQFGVGPNPTNPSELEGYFQSQNVAHARIFGWEFSTGGTGHITQNVDMNVLLGYTYFYGADLDDTAGPNNRNVGTFLKDAFKSYVLPTATSETTWDSITQGQLKYRIPHQFKGDVDFVLFRKVHVGTAFTYYSYMTVIDNAFTFFIPGMLDYREDTRNKGSSIWDLRCGYIFNTNLTLNFLVKNVLNSFTSIRPAEPDPPRSYTVQLLLSFGGLHKHSARTDNL